MLSGNYKMTAQTMFGLEEVLAAELRKLGAREVEQHNRAVSFVGDIGFMYKANLCLYTALRILVPVKTFSVRNEQDLYDEIKKIDWETYMGVDDTLAVNCSLNSELFNHSQFLSQKTKDAVVDQFREKHQKRPSVDLDQPTLRIHLFVSQDTCMVSLDSSGESLHKRGYRDMTNLAPINEVLAAGIVKLTGWDGYRNFVDPMCGSGTILIEAALQALSIPAGYYRKSFGFMRWKNFDETLWNKILDAAVAKIKEGDKVKLLGGEISKNVARKAVVNIHEAKVDDVVTIRTAAFDDLEVPAGGGILVINPPYGERMDKDEDIMALYKSIGDTLKKKWAGYEAWIITSNMEAAKAIRLDPSRKIKLFNGALECRLLKFELYSGTRRKDKLAEQS
jgi:putative N6-adenine-specific DNA methylase